MKGDREDIILSTVAGLLVPLIQVFAFYIIWHGHLSPGGAFAGGAVLAASLVLRSLALGQTIPEAPISHLWYTRLESGGILWFIALGLVGVVRGSEFLSNASAGFPLGQPGRLFSSGLILAVTVGVGLKVASGLTSLLQALLEGERDG